MGRAYIERYLELRAELRGILGGLVERGARAGRIDRLDDGGLQRRARRARPRRRGRDRDDDRRALRAPRPAARVDGARGRGAARSGRDRRCRWPAHPPGRDLAGPVDDGRGASRSRAARADGRPDPGRRRTVRGRDPRDRRRPRLPDHLGAEVALRARGDRRARRLRTPSGFASRVRATSHRSRTTPTARSCHSRERGGSTRTGCPRRRSPGFGPRSRLTPGGATSGRRGLPRGVAICWPRPARTSSLRPSGRRSSPGVRTTRRRATS